MSAREERMSETLGNLLVDLASQPDLLRRFSANPEAELARTALTAQERAVMMTRDSRLVGIAIGASPAKSGGGITSKKKGGKKKKGSRKPAKKR
jgi:hypothetical protein